MILLFSLAPPVGIDGRWTVVRAEFEGQPWSFPMIAGIKDGRLRPSGRRDGGLLQMQLGGQISERSGAIDLGDEAARLDTGRALRWQGIYRWDGDRLLLCWSHLKRPNGFSTMEGDGSRLVVLERERR